MELRQLRYFVKVVEVGSISRAAMDLDLVQSALSQQITRLESELSTRLLQRTPQGVTPTEAGVAFFREAQLTLRHAEQAVRSAEQMMKSTQMSLKAGSRTQLDVLNAQQQYTLALRDLAQARFVYLMSKVKLASLVGDDAVASVDDVNGSLVGVAR